MSKANNSKRKKLLVNIMYCPGLSGTDKMIFYAMNYKYVDGEQLLDYIQRHKPTLEQIQEYVEEKLKENRVKK